MHAQCATRRGARGATAMMRASSLASSDAAADAASMASGARGARGARGGGGGDATNGWDDGSRLAVAPGLDVTTVGFRAMARSLTSHARLWTEMAHHDAVERYKSNTMMRCEGARVTAQLGGSDPSGLARATAVLVDDYGYDEVNLNCGCPSDRVCGKADDAKTFGAALMLDGGARAAECARRMAEACDVGKQVTVKHRLGVRFDKTMTKSEDTDSYDYVVDFVENVREAAGVEHFIVHARSAVLGGLNPCANRRVPPLRYDEVYALCDEFPKCGFTLNGGVTSLEQARELLDRNDGALRGVMMGRAFYKHSCLLADIDRIIFDDDGGGAPRPTRADVVKKFGEFCDGALAAMPPMDHKERKKHCRRYFKVVDGLTFGTRTGGKIFRRAGDEMFDTYFGPDDNEPFSKRLWDCTQAVVDAETWNEELKNINPDGENTYKTSTKRRGSHRDRDSDSDSDDGDDVDGITDVMRNTTL